MTFLRRTPVWAGIITLAWVATLALFQAADSIDVVCRSETQQQAEDSQSALLLWAAVSAVAAFAAGVAGAVLCRVKRGLLVLAALLSLGLACLAVVYSFLVSLSCAFD
jgi:hypothetical protein